MLERAVAEAPTRFAEHLVESEERELKRRTLEEWLRGVLNEAGERQRIFGEATVVRDEWIGTLGLLASIPVRASMAGGDPLESYYAVQAFSSQRAQLAHLHQRAGNIVLAMNEVSDEVGAAIRTAIANAGQQVARLREMRVAQAQAHEEFASIVRDRFGALKGD